MKIPVKIFQNKILSWYKKNGRHHYKKSKQYTRQSKFEGSQRQARAYVLKNILSQGDVSTKDVQGWLKEKASLVKYEPISIVRRILQEMEEEGFLTFENGRWCISELSFP